MSEDFVIQSIGALAIFAVFVVIELKSPRNKILKRLERKILEPKK